MGLYRSVSGIIEVELTGADTAASLQKINSSGIAVYDLRSTGDLTVHFSILRKDYSKLCSAADKNGDTLKMKNTRGIYWSAKRMFQRPMLLLGLIAVFLVAWLIPGRILIIEVEGNATIATQQILEAASDSGIRLGASGREVRSEKMKNALLSKLPQLQWAGINTYGSRAVITVRERAAEPSAENAAGVSSIVADRDGIILSCTATRGSALCSPGQAVRKGDVLISGYTDCGLTIEATRAEGEIIALTRRSVSAKILTEEVLRTAETEKNLRLALQIGKKRINFYKGSGISDGSCVKMYSKYVLTLPGGYALPVAVILETVTDYDFRNVQLDESQSSSDLSDFLERYLIRQMIAGSILKKTETFSKSAGTLCMDGYYVCQEMIGRVRPERIGEHHGKTD